MDYTQALVIYSGGEDSTDFIENEPTAKYLLHYPGSNEEQTKMAAINANISDRFINIQPARFASTDGETNQIHALNDAEKILNACIIAVSHCMKSVVACFNADDLGTDFDAIQSIVNRAVPDFKLILPLRETPAAKIRARRASSKLKAISCMHSDSCGHCIKCQCGY